MAPAQNKLSSTSFWGSFLLSNPTKWAEVTNQEPLVRMTGGSVGIFLCEKVAYGKKKQYLCSAKVEINSSLYQNNSYENFKHPTRDAFWLRERKRQQCTKEILYC
jgi:hypothetical protein